MIKIAKVVLFAMWLCIGAMPALSQNSQGQNNNNQGQNNNNQGQNNNNQGYRTAPAPLIGVGIPVALAVGGVLLGSKLLKRRR
jgi:hypothetical protein